MQVHTLTVTRSARYYMLGQPSGDIRQLWIVCHGYGQLAAYFIQKFKLLDDGHTLVVAPEALSHFYLNGTSGRVGASWMTKEDRQAEIADYTNYLDQLANLLTSTLPADVKVYVMGFSQGVATVCRWLAAGNTPCHGLVLWAGVFPPDLEPDTAFRALQNIPVKLVAGRHDPYITEQAANTQLALLSQNGVSATLHWYEGAHEIDSLLMQQLHKKWSNP